LKKVSEKKKRRARGREKEASKGRKRGRRAQLAESMQVCEGEQGGAKFPQGKEWATEGGSEGGTANRNQQPLRPGKGGKKKRGRDPRGGETRTWQKERRRKSGGGFKKKNKKEEHLDVLKNSPGAGHSQNR